MMRCILLVAALLVPATAVAEAVELHYFSAATCPDCLVMKGYLATLSVEFPGLRIVEHEVGFSGDNYRLMAAVAESYGLEKYATPVVAVGDLATTGIGLAVELRLHEEIARCVTEGCPSPLSRLPEAPRWRLSPIDLVVILAVGTVAILLLAWILPK